MQATLGINDKECETKEYFDWDFVSGKKLAIWQPMKKNYHKITIHAYNSVASIEIQVEWFLIFLHHQFYENFLISLEKLNVVLESFKKLSGS